VALCKTCLLHCVVSTNYDYSICEFVPLLDTMRRLRPSFRAWSSTFRQYIGFFLSCVLKVFFKVNSSYFDPFP
jgi:hypothetical protein